MGQIFERRLYLEDPLELANQKIPHVWFVKFRNGGLPLLEIVPISAPGTKAFLPLDLFPVETRIDIIRIPLAKACNLFENWAPAEYFLTYWAEYDNLSKYRCREFSCLFGMGAEFAKSFVWTLSPISYPHTTHTTNNK